MGVGTGTSTNQPFTNGADFPTKNNSMQSKSSKSVEPTATRSNPTALIFDFDGLICDTEGCLLSAAERVFNRYQVKFPFEKWLDVVGTASPPNFWVPWLQEGTDSPVDEIAAIAEFDEYNAAAIEHLRPNAGVVELLDLAQCHDIALGVASSSSIGWVGRLLDQLGLGERFSQIVTRGDVRRAKPAPDLYLLAAKNFGSNPAHCIALEDSRNGSLAALRAGMPVVVVPNELTKHQDLSHATHCAPSLLDVTLDVLRDIRRRNN